MGVAEWDEVGEGEWSPETGPRGAGTGQQHSPTQRNLAGRAPAASQGEAGRVARERRVVLERAREWDRMWDQYVAVYGLSAARVAREDALMAPIRYPKRPYHRDRREAEETPETGVLADPLDGEGLFTRTSLRRRLQKCKYRRAVPDGSCAKETLQIIAGRCVELSKALVLCYNAVHSQQRVPRGWQDSMAVQIGKGNGKTGCAAIRLINVLPPDGKVFFSQMWARATPREIPWAYGFYTGRRREQAILVQNALGWRLRRLGMGHTLTLHDVANAFPSPSHEALATMIRECAMPCDRDLLCHRFRNTRMTVTERNGDAVTVSPQCGGLQGDASMAPMFRSLYDKQMQKWDADRMTRPRVAALSARHPLTGIRVQVSRTVYADDVAETNLTGTPDEMVATIRDSDAQLDAALGEVGLRQNYDKAEHVPVFMGKGSVAATREVQRRDGVPGRVVRQARYLGNIRQADGGTQANVDKRRGAAQEAFYLLKGFWGSKNGADTVRRVFHSNVVGAALAGLEAEVLTTTDLARLDTLLARLAREAMGKRAWRAVPGGEDRPLRNGEIREWMRLPTVETELRSRRLRWWAQMVCRPRDSVQVMAALFAPLQLEIDLGVRAGDPPWVEQLRADWDELERVTGEALGMRGIEQQHGVAALLGPHWRAWWSRRDTRGVRSYRDRQPAVEPDEGRAGVRVSCGLCGADGAPCAYTGTRLQVVTHQRYVHGVQDVARRVVVGNSCPLCGRAYKKKRDAEDHVARAVEGGMCPVTRGTAKFAAERAECEEWTCPLGCGVYTGREEASAHAAAHLRDMAVEGTGIWHQVAPTPAGQQQRQQQAASVCAL